MLEPDGLVVILEPIHLAGNLGKISLIYNNEERVRAEARNAIVSLLGDRLEIVKHFIFSSISTARSAKEFLEHEILSKTWISIPNEKIELITHKLNSSPRNELGEILLEEMIEFWCLRTC